MTQDTASVDEIEIWDPEENKSLSVPAEEQHEEIDALRDRIETKGLDLDAERVYDTLSDETLADARYTARHLCLEHGNFTRYMEFLVDEIIQRS